MAVPVAGDQSRPTSAGSIGRYGTAGTEEFTADLTVCGERATHHGAGAGPVEALTGILAAAGLPVEVLSLGPQSPGARGVVPAIAYVERRCAGRVAWAAGTGASPLEASLAAVVAAAHHGLSGA